MSLTAPDEDRMTPRAQWYMAICAARHCVLGVLCVLDPGTFTSPSYRGMLAAIPVFRGADAIVVWGVVFLAAGIVAAAATATRGATVARVALTVSVVVTAAWCGGFIVSALHRDLAGWSGPVVWAALVAKDLVMLRDPLVVPFEQWDRWRRRAAQMEPASAAD